MTKKQENILSKVVGNLSLVVIIIISPKLKTIFNQQLFNVGALTCLTVTRKNEIEVIKVHISALIY